MNILVLQEIKLCVIERWEWYLNGFSAPELSVRNDLLRYFIDSFLEDTKWVLLD